jgi:hypothetical protein
MIDLIADTEELVRIWIGGTALFYLFMNYATYGGLAVLKDKK